MREIIIGWKLSCPHSQVVLFEWSMEDRERIKLKNGVRMKLICQTITGNSSVTDVNGNIKSFPEGWQTSPGVGIWGLFPILSRNKPAPTLSSFHLCTGRIHATNWQLTEIIGLSLPAICLPFKWLAKYGRISTWKGQEGLSYSPVSPSGAFLIHSSISTLFLSSLLANLNQWDFSPPPYWILAGT